MFATNSQQSIALIEMGIDKNTADMSIDIDTGKYYLAPYSQRVDKLHELPAWSLSKLLSMMPSHLDDETAYYTFAITNGEIQDCKPSDVSGNLVFHMGSEDDTYYFEYDDNFPSGLLPQGGTAIEAAVKMMVWLLANDLINNHVYQ